MTFDTEAVLQAHNPVAEILEALMDKHSLNQTDLAHRSGVSQPAINRILKERSKAKKPRRETLEKIGGVLGVTPEQLMGQEPISVKLFDKGAVPLGRWETLTHTPHLADAPLGCALVCPVPHSEMSFALPVIGEAMVAEDGYREGEVIFVDSTVEPTHGRDVVAVSPKAAYLRRLITTPEGQFLKALNPHWPNPILPLTNDIIVMGTVVFSGRVRT
ncbi:LexA family protein [Sulfuritalea hydrogenivorans]|uniref:DNA binding domain/peptidase S24 domain phage protein n=1 Tax=Sulfuritalea hydrogenivorans sk43H TaxID=1223802 RepID=W0SIF9_9PROT|nr:S24 family peptidase [Sulfuritalea hydrogenivorans]BAO29723.1 DNA binding domain/peptidase S24 domain phage protein [Sulfuritalea hydrogenivorans sk43H]